MMTPEGLIGAAARSVAETLQEQVPQDVGFAVILFHRGGGGQPHIGTNVEHALLLRMLDKAKDAAILDASRLVRPG